MSILSFWSTELRHHHRSGFSLFLWYPVTNPFVLVNAFLALGEHPISLAPSWPWAFRCDWPLDSLAQSLRLFLGQNVRNWNQRSKFSKILGRTSDDFGLRDSHLQLSLRTNWIHMDPWSVQGIGLVSGDGQWMVLPKDLAVEQFQGSVHLVALANLDSPIARISSAVLDPIPTWDWFQTPVYILSIFGSNSSGSVNICRHFRYA